jgi:serine/threonine protein kinase
VTSQLPSRIGPFDIRAQLGKGGMGVVYLAYDPPLDRLVAVKVLGVLDEEVQRRFLKEARFAARVQHPHIVSIYAVGEHDGRPYIAMEYIAGDTLAAIMRSGEPTGLGRRVQWLFELASGLEFAHRNGVVHRDVKPANLIISRDSGLLRLLDFGIARDHESEATMGAILGTPQYMSPEQVTGAAVDARSDIFAFGLVAYELLSGHRAVEGPHVVEIARQIIEVEPVRLSERMPGLPVELVDLVHHCLAKAPDQRPPDLTWVLPRLRRIMRTLEDSTDDATVVRPLRPAGSTPAARPRPVTPYPGQTEALQQRQERRKREVAGHVMRAHAALTLGDLEAAAEAAEQAAMLDEQDSEVRAVLQRLDEVRQERELASGLADAQRLLEAGQAPEAISQLERLRMTMPS